MSEAELSPRERKEKLVTSFLTRKPGGNFLEIGIGGLPKLPRLRVLRDNQINYVGADFVTVCREHEKRIRADGMGDLLDTGKFRFWSNPVGSYNYNLLKMLRAGLQFDAIYLDGHHTLEIDLPAAILAAALLKPDGLFAVDDIEWSLSKLARLMYEKFDLWLYFKDTYDFTRYEADEIYEKPMKVIVDEVLIPHLNFRVEDSLSYPGWSVLRKSA